MDVESADVMSLLNPPARFSSEQKPKSIFFLQGDLYTVEVQYKLEMCAAFVKAVAKTLGYWGHRSSDSFYILDSANKVVCQCAYTIENMLNLAYLFTSPTTLGEICRLVADSTLSGIENVQLPEMYFKD